MYKLTEVDTQRGINNDVKYMPRTQNQRDLATRLDANMAVQIQNYFPTGDGRLIAREGLNELVSVSGTMKGVGELGSDIVAYAYDDGSNTKLYTYKISTGTSTLQNTFTSRDNVTMTRYGKFLYASDGTDKVGCIYQDGSFLTFGSGTAEISVGDTITGGTSGATAYVDAIWLVSGTWGGGNAAGILMLTNVSGNFQNETITSATGSATASAVQYQWYEISDAPAVKHLETFRFQKGTTLIGLGIKNDDYVDDTLLRYSEYHTLDNLQEIPFTDWTPSSPPTVDDAGAFVNRTGGTGNDVVAHENRVYVFYDDATAVWHVESIDVTGFGLSRTEVVDQQGNNFGGYSAVATPKGVFYTNENGVNMFNLTGTSDVEMEVSNILGEEKVENINFEGSKMQWDGKSRIYIQCRVNGSTYNNFCLVYDINFGLWSEITGWNIYDSVRIATGNKNELYGVDSLDGKLYKMLSGHDDNGENIEGKILLKQENAGAPVTAKNMQSFWIKGKLSPSNLIRIAFHTWDKMYNLTEDAAVFWWQAGTGTLTPYGYGVTSYGKGIQDGEEFYTNEDYAQKWWPIRGYLKYQIEISTSYQTDHEIHFIQVAEMSTINSRPSNLLTSKP